MGKKEDLLNRLGGNMSESIGARESVHGEPTVEKTTEGSDKYRGRSRSRSAGEMELSRIVGDPDQPRTEFEQDDLKRLSDSIRQHGVLQNIRVRWHATLNKWMVISGERRFRAAKLAGLTSIPCVFVEDDVDESNIRAQQLIENCVRSDLKPIEQARAFLALMDLTHWSTQRLATELNISKATVIRSLALLKLPADVRESVESGNLAPSVAYTLSRVKGTSQQRELARAVVDNRLTRDEAQKLISPEQRPKPRPTTSNKIEPNQQPPKSPHEPAKTVKRFTTRHAVIIVEHENAHATTAELQAAMLAVVKVLGSKTAKTDMDTSLG